ncbi:MAG: hypothetical protein Q7U76_12855 [Nitrospirota bacterium]|nr:hypothetical protein [Nitrospirota bacterium]
MDLSQHLSNGGMVTDAHAVLVAFIGPDGPEVLWNGVANTEQLKEVGFALGDLLQDSRYAIHKESTVERVRKNKQADKERERKYLEDHPWLCTGDRCTRRFKTERGAEIHERTCWRMKKRGGYAGSQQD